MSEQHGSDTGRGSGTELALPDLALPEILYLMPVTTRPFMPAQIQPMMADAAAWGDTVQRVAQADHKIMGLFFVDTDDTTTVKQLLDHLMTLKRPRQVVLSGRAGNLVLKRGDAGATLHTSPTAGT